MRSRSIQVAAPLAFLLVQSGAALGAGPDLIVGSITATNNYGQVGGIHAYSLGVIACNLGDANSAWIDSTADHPLLAQSLYRLRDGRLEQIGISFALHTSSVLESNFCSTCQPGGNFQFLAPGCSTASSPSLSGLQSTLGPRFEVNASTGVFAFPFTGAGQAGNAIFKRIQAPASSLTMGDEYFVEAQLLAPDDTVAGAGDNNASYRRANLLLSGSLALTGPTLTETPAIFAWGASDPGVAISTVDIPGDGRMHVGANATEIAPGQWRYDYAIHNLTSHRSAGSISVPGVGAVSGDTFQAPSYHSGEPVDNAPWSFALASGFATWSIPAHTPGTDQSANAVRWGTMYTFSLVSDAPPVDGPIEVGLFRPGAQGSFVVTGPVPGIACVADLAPPAGVLDFSDVAAFLSAFGTMSPEADLSEPFGSFDFSDVAAFLTAFGAGCP